MERIPVRVGAHTVTAFSEGAGDDAILVVHGGPGVTAPTLVAASEHDYILPELCAVSCQHLPNSEYAFFPGCSHIPFWENPEGYHGAIGAFLEKYR